MNWKLVATLIVGSALLAGCSATASQAPVNSSDTRTQQPDAPSGGADKGTTAPPATAPAPADPPLNANKNVVVHE